jgi:hypothetical protein
MSMRPNPKGNDNDNDNGVGVSLEWLKGSQWELAR